ncbi:MAG: hypothetical protein QOI95_1886 [Acidimicrobiaceae bacterium]|jgi:hypothetical protein
MSRRARRNSARLVGLALIAVALMLMAGTGSAGADGPAATLAAKGWWWKAQDSSLPTPLPAPPNVQAGQLNVQGNPTDPKGTAFAAVRFTVGTDQTVKSLTMKVADDKAAATAVLLACQTGSTWTGVENGTWQSAPTVTSSCINGQKATDGKSWTFAVGPLQLATLLDIAIIPGVDPATSAPAAFSLVLDAPTSASLETFAAPPPTVAPVANNNPAAGSNNGSTAGAGTSTGTVHPPVITPVATGLPADKVGETATAPSKQAATTPVNTAASAPAKDRNKTAGYIVLAFAAAIGLYAWRQDNLMAMNGGSLPGAAEEPGGLGRFSRPRQGVPPALT